MSRFDKTRRLSSLAAGSAAGGRWRHAGQSARADRLMALGVTPERLFHVP